MERENMLAGIRLCVDCGCVWRDRVPIACIASNTRNGKTCGMHTHIGLIHKCNCQLRDCNGASAAAAI